MKIIIGAANTKYDGWFSTNKDTLDLTKAESFLPFEGSISHFLAEHVWEHLTYQDAQIATRNCFYFLKSGGRLRLAVPDGFKPDPEYIEWVRVGGANGKNDHKQLYNYRTLSEQLSSVGFVVNLLEYWDENGGFHHKEWNPEDGYIKRSMNNDHRNKEKPLSYTSLIVDAIKF